MQCHCITSVHCCISCTTVVFMCFDKKINFSSLFEFYISSLFLCCISLLLLGYCAVWMHCSCHFMMRSYWSFSWQIVSACHCFHDLWQFLQISDTAWWLSQPVIGGNRVLFLYLTVFAPQFPMIEHFWSETTKIVQRKHSLLYQVLQKKLCKSLLFLFVVLLQSKSQEVFLCYCFHKRYFCGWLVKRYQVYQWHCTWKQKPPRLAFFSCHWQQFCLN